MRILILGKDGQLGQALQTFLGSSTFDAYHEILTLGHEGVGNLSHPAPLAATIRDYRPDILFNAAAYTNVEAAETPSGRFEAFLVNAKALKTLASTCEKCGSLLVHYSTDYVFDGEKNGAYLESDKPHPINAYGKSKLAGEEILKASNCQSLIFRTSWLYSEGNRNFVSAILRKALRGDPISVVTDQTGVPTSARFLAEASANIAFRAQAAFLHEAKEHFRIIHAVPNGCTAWFDFAKFILTKAEELGLPIRTRANEIRPTISADYPCKAIRPHNSCLKNSLLAACLKSPLVSWTEDAAEVMRKIAELSGK